MKLSNKLLIGFFGVLFLYMLLAFAEVRVRGERTDLHGDMAVVETLPLGEIGHLVIPDLNKRVTIHTDSKPRIQLRSMVGDLANGVSYVQIGDTLRLEQLDIGEDIRYHLQVFVRPGQLRSIDATHASLQIGDLGRSTFTLKQTGGFVTMIDQTAIDTLALDASMGAQFDAWQDTKAQVLLVTMDKANVEFRGSVTRLQGEMANNSYLSVGQASEFAFNKDKTSRLNYTN